MIRPLLHVDQARSIGASVGVQGIGTFYWSTGRSSMLSVHKEKGHVTGALEVGAFYFCTESC